jgi:hypothetical protein
VATRKLQNFGGQRELAMVDVTTTGPLEAIVLARGDVTVQISGSGTISAQVERSTPSADAAFSPAEDDGFAGDTDSLSPRVYTEAGQGNWRVNVLAITGTATISIMGVQP